LHRSLPALFIFLSACAAAPKTISAPVRRGAADRMAHDGAVTDAERLWSERLDSAKLRGAIGAWKRAVALADDDARSWLMLSRAQYFLADGFLDLEHAADDEVTKAFEEGAAYADRGLRALSPSYEARRQAGLDVDEAAEGLGAEVVPFTYWWGLNAIRWADRKGWATGATVYHHVQQVMERVAKLAPSFDHAGADRYFGAFYTDAPGLAGGDVAKGKAHLDQALERDPNYLENWVVIAQRYARKTKDGALYQRARQFVLDTPAAVVPDAVPEQEIAKKKARILKPQL
jgi:tetratricopeptide (TPR) repeat protein